MCSIICYRLAMSVNVISNTFARRIAGRVSVVARHIIYCRIVSAGHEIGFRRMAIHIGREIKAELQRQERGATWLADKLHCDRTNVYDIFKRQGIDTRLLERISIILHRNFFSLYCQEDSDDVENVSTQL